MFEFLCDPQYWEDHFIEMAAIILALCTFILERILNYKREKKNSKYDWFLKIIVEPNLDDIKEFYIKADNDLRIACKDLQNRESSLNDMEYAIQVRTYHNTFKTDRRKFFNNFVSMIGSFDKKMALKVDGIINELDDFYGTALDYANSDVNTEGMIADIFKNKADLYQTLFKRIS